MGLRLPPADYANNDLNLSDILTNGQRITGVVDWDEFGLGNRALDLTALAFDLRARRRSRPGRSLVRPGRVGGRPRRAALPGQLPRARAPGLRAARRPARRRGPGRRGHFRDRGPAALGLWLTGATRRVAISLNPIIALAVPA